MKSVESVLAKPIFDLTSERVKEVERRIERLEGELKMAETATPEGVWREELERLREEITKFYAEREDDEEKEERKRKAGFDGQEDDSDAVSSSKATKRGGAGRSPRTKKKQ